MAALALGDHAAGLAALEPAARTGAYAERMRLLRMQLLLRAPGRLAEGAQAWFDGVTTLSSAGAAQLFDDLQDLLSPAEHDAWQAMDLPQRRQWLAQFWDVRAALSGMTVAERMAEHYRRVDVALERYPRRVRYGAPPRNALLLPRPDSRFDDRGIIYIRHGEPRRIIRTPHLGRNLQQNESWLYDTPEGGVRMMHFVHFGELLGRGDAYPEFLLVHLVPCNPDYIADRANYDRRFIPYTHRCSATDRLMLSAEVRGDAWQALRTDTHRPTFEPDLPFRYEWFSFRAPNSHTELVGAVLIGSVQNEEPPDSIRIMLAVADTATRRVAALDTTVNGVRATFGMRVLPAAHAVQRITVRAGSTDRGGFAGGPLHVTDFSGDTLMLSDIVLGKPADAASSTAWRRGGAALDVLPAQAFTAGPLRVYYEIYNLPASATCRTEILVEKVRGGIGRMLGRTSPVRLQFTEAARANPAGDVQQVRDISASLEPGRWRLRITIGDETGRTVRREREFVVVRP
jgi:hypothetical protein